MKFPKTWIPLAILAILMATAAAATPRPQPQAATTPNPCALNEEINAWLAINSPNGSRERNLDTDLSAFVADVQAFCAQSTTTTSSSTTTASTSSTTTTTAPTTTTSSTSTTTSTTAPPPPQCASTATGEYVVSTNGAVIDGLCLNGGSLVITADNVVVRNSRLTANPPNDFVGVFLTSSAQNAEVHHNLIDCGAADEGTPVASHGFQGDAGSTLNAHHNEIRDCTDPIILASNSTYAFNNIHSPDNTDGSHADGVEFSAEDGTGIGIHDVLFEHNTINFPDASSSFQFHNTTDPNGWPKNITVRYNTFLGGAAVLRVPGRNCSATACNGVNLQVYGNRLDLLTPNEFFLCDGHNETIAVWGAETGNPADANVDNSDGTVLPRSICNG